MQAPRAAKQAKISPYALLSRYEAPPSILVLESGSSCSQNVIPLSICFVDVNPQVKATDHLRVPARACKKCSEPTALRLAEAQTPTPL
mmetsp:Transcript_11518/g.13656  ORF Transcript_11518/g.13656 Transcript_11518/m.13656 type:complete len:88 (+) Transcript_11518:200-463(+)